MTSRAAQNSVPAFAALAAYSASRLFFQRLALLFFSLCLCASAAKATNVRIGPLTNSFLEADTNFVILVPVSGPIANADGSFTAIGLPRRIYPTTDGSITNNLAANNWLATNADLAPGIVFRVPQDSGPTVYSMYDLRISGYNTFVTVYLTNGAAGSITRDGVTNALGGDPILSTNLPALTNGYIRLLDVTNVSDFKANSSSNALYSDYTTKIAIITALSITNIYATNAAGVSWVAGRGYISTNYDALGTALAIGAAGTNYTLAASNSLYALQALSLTNAFATNAAGVTYSGGRAYISTNYDALGIALAIGAAGTNYTLAASNALYALQGVSLTNAFATNAAGVTYSGGRAYISTNYDALGTALAIGAAGTNYTLAASNSLYALQALSLTNAFATNAAGVTYSGGRAYISTNYDALGTALAIGAAGTNYVNAVSNILAGQITAGGISAVNATNLQNSLTGVVATNGAPSTLIFTSSGTNAILGIAETLTNGFVDKSITNGYATQAYAQGLTNGFVTKAITNNAATVAQLNQKANTNAPTIYNPVFSATAVIGSGTIAATNAFQVDTLGGAKAFQVNTNGDTFANGKVTLGNPSLGAMEINSTEIMLLPVGGEWDLIGPQGQNIGWDSGGAFSISDSGGEELSLAPGGVLLQDGNSHAIQLDTTSGNVTLNGGGAWSGPGHGLTDTSSSNLQAQAKAQVTNIVNAAFTNGFGTGMQFTNTALLGNVSFGSAGQATNIDAGFRTNYIYFVGAGSGIVTNGAFIWDPTQGQLTNWLTGVIVTNNGSASLVKSNGTTLYSLAGTSFLGTYSTVGGANPAPTAYSTVALNDHFIFLGYWSVTNQNANSNNIINFGNTNFIAQTGGFGTNARIVTSILIADFAEKNFAGASGQTINFASASFGEANTNTGGSTFGSAILSGTTNRITTGGADVIAGGAYNTLNGSAGNGDAIVAGYRNTLTSGTGISGQGANIIGAGISNALNNTTFSSILGGYGNSSQSNYSIILGGIANTNLEDGGVILGGRSNRLSGVWALAAGRNVTVSNDNDFAWSDGIAMVTRTNSQFNVTATNGEALNGPLYLGTANTNSGVYWLSNTWSLWAVTNSMGVGDVWRGNSNGWPVQVWNSNGVFVIKNLWQ